MAVMSAVVGALDTNGLRVDRALATANGFRPVWFKQGAGISLTAAANGSEVWITVAADGSAVTFAAVKAALAAADSDITIGGSSYLLGIGMRSNAAGNSGTLDLRGGDVVIQANGASGTLAITGNGSGGIQFTGAEVHLGPNRHASYVDFDPISAPAAPATGRVRMYLDTGTGKITFKESDGTTHTAW